MVIYYVMQILIHMSLFSKTITYKANLWQCITMVKTRQIFAASEHFGKHVTQKM